MFAAVMCIAAASFIFGPVGRASSLTSIFTSTIPLSNTGLFTQVTEPAEKISAEVIEDTDGGKAAEVVIFLADQADVTAAYQIADEDERGWYVYKALTLHAEETQAPLRSFLLSKGAEYQSFWAANMIVAVADRDLVNELAQRPDVARIDSNRPTRWVEDPAIADPSDAPRSPEAPAAAEWGVTNVNAPQVWAQGFTGQGIVIGELDTGVRWTHSVLKPKYRGWNGTTADHNFNWWDSVHSGGGSCGFNTTAPCDDQGHGTHTAGTTVGDDGTGNQVGVAPGAKWIGCRNMNVGNGTPATYTECFQFMIAPTDLAGNNANPSLRPHVLNNSWGCPTSEGCTTRAELETIVNNTDAAGIFVAVSAGNTGAGCSTVNDPPAIYAASFSTGAYDINNNLASFSSRGPSTYYAPNLLKPNISAPGVGVRSSTRTNDTSFGSFSGTSMAAPHVTGVVALLWSARPALQRNTAATRALLQNTANPVVNVAAQTCGGTPTTAIPNNTFGYGRVDAFAAYIISGGGTPTPTNTPTATPTNTPTATPTNTPTATPTNTPTATPTNTPTATPTNTPTATPTNTPTATPTNTPTATPTNTPTATPTNTPTATPTNTPTGSPTPTPAPLGWEGDIIPRPNGDGFLNAPDVIMIRRFATGLDTPAGGTNEAQRADSAPLATNGDGLINSGDVIQVRRFAAGLDGLVVSSGPTGSSMIEVVRSAVDKVYSYFFGAEVRVGPSVSNSPKTVTVPVEMTPVGNEAALSFTLEYDSSKLSNPRVVLGTDVTEGWILTVNSENEGRLGILVDSAVPLTSSLQPKQIVAVTFDVLDGSAGDSEVSLTGSLAEIGVSDEMGRMVSVRFIGGSLALPSDGSGF